MDRVTSTDSAPSGGPGPGAPTGPTDGASTPPAPGAPPRPAATSTHGRGNWRSLVISMVIMTAIVFAAVALMPHPAQRERNTVDIARSASQLAQEKGWPLATVRTGADWHPTLVSFQADDKGVPTWQVGYHHLPGDDRYIALAQTRPGDGVSADQVAGWVDRQAANGREGGTVQIDGVTWARRSATLEGGQDRVRRSLVAQGPDAPGGLVTVLSGEVDEADLERFAGELQLQPTGTATSGAAQPSSAGSSSTSEPASPAGSAG